MSEDNRLGERSKKTGIVFFILVIIGLSLFIYLSQSQNTALPGYIEGQQTILTTIAPYIEDEKTPDMQSFKDETIGLSMQVPMGWSRVIKDGYVTYIHPNTAAYIQIQTIPYYPGVMDVNEADLKAGMAEKGMALISFKPEGNYGRTIMYQSKDAEGKPIDMIEVTRYDRSTVVNVVYSVPDEYYKRLEKEAVLSAESIRWEPKDPVPHTFTLSYNKFGNFEFAVPINWQRSIEDGAFMARDQETGAYLRVNVFQSNANYAQTTQLTYQDIAGRGRDKFAVKQFTADARVIYAEATYMEGTMPVTMIDYMIANGQFEYQITFVCPSTFFNDLSPNFAQAIQLFRIF